MGLYTQEQCFHLNLEKPSKFVQTEFYSHSFVIIIQTLKCQGVGSGARNSNKRIH
jgi:hypothetical protein